MLRKCHRLLLSRSSDTDIIERGLQFPRRAFSVSLKTRDASLAGAILGFDADNQVIFGIFN
jgi:hypothetical protein